MVIVWCLAAAVALHLLFFAIGAVNNGRAPFAAFGENLRMYNPFSWEGCVEARIENLRGVICPKHGNKHETLGLVTWADLDDSAKRDRIAREAFISRTTFWVTGTLHFGTSLGLVAVIAAAFRLIAGVL